MAIFCGNCGAKVGVIGACKNCKKRSVTTPGPWEAIDIEAGILIKQANTDGGHVTKIEGPLMNIDRGNAQLIAAAPELRNCLGLLYAELADAGYEHYDCMKQAKGLLEMLSCNPLNPQIKGLADFMTEEEFDGSR